MLSSRFLDDKKPAIALSNSQLKNKKIVEKKITDGIYKFEKVKCAICKSENFKTLSKKDRHGLYSSFVICKNCGLIQINPRMDQKSYNNFYNDEYRKVYSETGKPADRFFRNQRFTGKLIYDLIRSKSNKNIKNLFVVEVGTGAGGILQYFKEKGNLVYGVDLGTQYISFGKKKGLNLETGTIKNVLKLNKKADIIIYSHVFEHILNPMDELKVIRKCLKKNGLLYIEVPGVKNLLNSYGQDFLKYLQNAHTYNFSLTTLNNCLQQEGFEMLYGDEYIKSIFIIGKKKTIYTNDYFKALSFLNYLEDLRLKRFSFQKLKLKLRSLFIQTLKKTKTFELFVRMYRKLHT
ncbi:MAG: class I SAM-dependent methyltransferase [archaeon]